MEQTETTAPHVRNQPAMRLVVYGRRFACGDQVRATDFLQRHSIAYDFVDISADPQAAQRLQDWVGHLSVPTLLVAAQGETEPHTPPTPLRTGQRVRGWNRGSMITEPSNEQLAEWLRGHGLLP